ncbi:GDSL esterase/lipase EXL6 [Pleurostoma richardsiae]|uniref:GDSL esterase/lipase EXL6 n=1 Tax=Pleurostoma richardsiae TaxID=41990 RepID=A0AA38RTV0_9PEZI|nr:GDSL esterase/lipase EXL6 [Pleurostoma richardsiae]
MWALLLLAGVASAAASCTPTKKLFSNLVTFGDSYTDDGRLGYYINNGGKPPPAGTMQTVSNVTASGGLAWGQFVAQYTDAKYYDYAISGATCSNEIISRYFSAIDKPFPAVLDDEIPSFVADVAAVSSKLYAGRTADNTVYALWIGTNDIGNGAFLTDSQTSGTNLTSYVDCIWSVFDHIYSTGGRRFVLLNNAPLHLAPMYASQSSGGVGDNQYWQNKTLYNETEYANKILEYTTTVNRVLDYGAPFQLLVKARWPGASFAVFDVHRLLTDIYYNPAAYLDAPANSSGFYHHCVPTNNSDCVVSPEPASSFLWYDELHPSEKTDSIIARHFIDVVAGNSSYGVQYGR